MYKTESNFRVSSFRNRLFAWIMLIVFCFSFMPSVSHAQQPTATLTALNGSVLVNGQEQGKGTILTTGDIIETQARASVILELSDGSQVELGENTKVDIAVLSQTVVGARVSRVKLLWGRIRAFLSPQHQIEGSSFDIETPNALIGVKFSEPDIEVSYSLERLETVGIAHTVELVAINLLTNEKIVVPVGSSVVIAGVILKIIAGTTAAALAAETGTAAAGTTTTGTTTGTTAGSNIGTMVAVAASVAAAGGVAAIVATQKGEEACTTAECTGDLSGRWEFSGSCVAQGCTEEMGCSGRGDVCGQEICDACNVAVTIPVTQSGNTLSGYDDRICEPYCILNGVVNGNSVMFTTEENGPPVPIGNSYSTWEGTLDGNIVRGTFSGFSSDWRGPGTTVPATVTWTGTFTVTIEKE